MKSSLLGLAMLAIVAALPSIASADVTCSSSGMADSFEMFMLKDGVAPFTAQYSAGNLGGSTDVSMTLVGNVEFSSAADGNVHSTTYSFVNDYGRTATFILTTTAQKQSTGALTTDPVGTVQFDNCTVE